MSCLSLNALFPGGSYLAERKIGLLAERSVCGDEGRETSERGEDRKRQDGGVGTVGRCQAAS